MLLKRIVMNDLTGKNMRSFSSWFRTSFPNKSSLVVPGANKSPI